jgi:hypothetical protein
MFDQSYSDRGREANRAQLRSGRPLTAEAGACPFARKAARMTAIGPNTLFVIGNKRSGTSHFVEIISRHRRVFVAPEADLIWSLSCHEAGRPITRYPDDGDRALKQTLASFESVITSAGKTPEEKFRLVLLEMAERAGKQPDQLAWIGDKKPVQQADPSVFEFTLKHWPKARYIHLVRHPQSVINSMISVASRRRSIEKAWKHGPEELMNLWTRNERWVLDHKLSGRAPILTVQFHELTEQPASAWNKIADFLELEADELLPAAAERTRPGRDQKYVGLDIPLTPQAAEIVKYYGLIEPGRD